MEEYKQVYLVLDRDTAGISHTRKALERNTGKLDKYMDRSEYYKGYKDLNDWLIQDHKSQNESQRIARRL